VKRTALKVLQPFFQIFKEYRQKILLCEPFGGSELLDLINRVMYDNNIISLVTALKNILNFLVPALPG